MPVKLTNRRPRGAVFLRNICPGVKRAFHAACVKEGVTMRRAVELLMDLYATDKKTRKLLRGVKS